MSATSIIKSKKQNGINKMNAVDVIIIMFTALLAIIELYPFYNSLLISFVTQGEYLSTPFMLFPKKITFDSYIIVFLNKSLFSGMGVTFVITLLGVPYSMLLTTSLAYAFNREFIGKKVMLNMCIFTMYFSGGLIPFYLLIKDLNLIDTLGAMILPVGISIMYMTVIRQFFSSIPTELSESATIDGATELTIFFRIMLPLSLPILATFSLYYAVERWNEWYNGMLFIKSFNKRPLQLVLRGIIQTTGNNLETDNSLELGIIPYSDGVKMACIVVTMFPIMCVYPFLQKYFVRGLTIGAVKG